MRSEHHLTTGLDQILASTRERRPNGHINHFKPYLQQRFLGGAANPAALFREIRGRGYRGSRVVATKHIATLRAGTAAADSQLPSNHHLDHAAPGEPERPPARPA